MQEKHVTKRDENREACASAAVTDESFAFMMCNENNAYSEGRFVLDSGATEHIVNDLNLFTECKKLMDPIRITVAKKVTVIEATHKGTIQVTTSLGYSGELKDVLYSRSVL